MNTLNDIQQVPVYSLTPDEATGNKNFRVYNYEGTFPNPSDLLIPHRKDHYLLVFIRSGMGRQWIDMTSYQLQENTIFFTGPGPIIVKEELKELWSTGIAFTGEFLSFQESASLSKLPMILNPHCGYELILSNADISIVEDLIMKITDEYHNPGEWQQRMLTAYMTVFLTYLSRLYTEQFNDKEPSADKLLLNRFREKINEYFLEKHEVGDYASFLNISAGHLSEVIKIQSGKPAIKHIHDRLILEARRLLFHTDNSLKEITFDLGFSDASYFNRFFKRETGITPADYRTSIRKMYH